MTMSPFRQLLAVALCTLFATVAAAQSKGEADPEGAKASPPSKSTLTRKQVSDEVKAAKKKNPELECGAEADPSQAKGPKPTPSTTTRAEVRAEAIKARQAGAIPCGEADAEKPAAKAKK